MKTDDVQMKDEAREDMNAYGAKIGLNEYLRTCMPKHTLPQRIVKRGEELTREELTDLLSFGRQIGATRALAVRGSVADDLVGLDDAVPTYFTTGTRADANRAASKIFSSLEDPDLRNLAMQECGGYNESSESVAFSNALKAPFIVAAEHPNQTDTLMVDVWNYECNQTPYQACQQSSRTRKKEKRDIYSGSLRDGAFLYPNTLEHDNQNVVSLDALRRIPALIQEARMHLGVSENDAFLFELGVHPSTEEFVILQTKFFARKQEGTSEKKKIGRRIFGIGELELPVWSLEDRTQCITLAHAAEEPFLFNPPNTHDELTHHDYSSWLTAYIPGKRGNATALIHNHLRFVRAALNNEGITILDHLANFALDEANSYRVHITSNGYEYSITGD